MTSRRARYGRVFRRCYELYQDRAGEWRWRLLTVNNRLIAESAEGYFNKQDCLDAIELVKTSGYAPVRIAKAGDPDATRP